MSAGDSANAACGAGRGVGDVYGNSSPDAGAPAGGGKGDESMEDAECEDGV